MLTLRLEQEAAPAGCVGEQAWLPGWRREGVRVRQQRWRRRGLLCTCPPAFVTTLFLPHSCRRGGGGEGAAGRAQRPEHPRVPGCGVLLGGATPQRRPGACLPLRAAADGAMAPARSHCLACCVLLCHAPAGNAVQMAAALADAALRAAPGARLASMAGGDKRNAIPRECSALLAVPAAEVAAAQAAVRARGAAYRREYGLKEPGLAVAAAQAAGGAPAAVLAPAATQRLLDLLLTLPHGALKMSHAVEGAARRAAVCCSLLRPLLLELGRLHPACHLPAAALLCVGAAMPLLFSGGALLLLRATGLPCLPLPCRPGRDLHQPGLHQAAACGRWQRGRVCGAVLDPQQHDGAT